MKRIALLALFAGLVFAAGIQVFPEAAYATDADGDGLDATLEAALGTDDNASDSDGDTLSDWVEVFELGTDPNSPDSDGDALTDDADPYPLDDGASAGGQSTPNTSYSCATDPAVAATPIEAESVNVPTGQLERSLVTMDFGPGILGRDSLSLVYGSHVSMKSPWGDGVVCTLDNALTFSGQDVTARVVLDEYDFTWNGAGFDRENGCPWTLTHDSPNDLYVLTSIRGGFEVHFDDTSGLQTATEDRFGNTTTITRNGGGTITGIQFPDGNSLTLTTYGSGRYYQVSDWSNPGRIWTLTYNYYDQLAKVTDPRAFTTQFYYVNGSATNSLNGNLVRIVLPEGQTRLSVEYDSTDRVSAVTRAGFEATFAYTSTSTTVVDFAGNQRVWNYSSGAVVPNSLVQSSNRDVRAGDPSTWTTSFAHNADLLRTKTVFPEGNRIDSDWNTNFCMTERRHKATDTDTDDNQDDLVWTFTYSSTYHVLDTVTDPEGNTTDRTFDGLEFVTDIEYETITHPDPDVTITESFTRNSAGQIETHTDGEGVVTRYDYYTSGAKNGLLWKKTVDYGSGKLNLVHEFDYADTRYLTSYEDPDGLATTFTVDLGGHRTGMLTPSPQSYETVYDWNSNGWLVGVDVENADQDGDACGFGDQWWETEYLHDDTGRVVRLTEEVDSTTTRETNIDFDGNGNVVMLTLPEGNQIEQVWDERDLLAERTRGFDTSDAATEYWVFDGNGNLVTFTDGRGKDWTKTYDDFDRVTKDTKPAGEYTSYVLDKNGNVLEIKGYDDQDTLLAHTKQSFDELNRVWKSERWLDHPSPTADEWHATTYTLDNRGLLVGVTDPLSHSTTTTFDNARRKTGWEDHLGNEIAWSYGNDFRVATQIDEIELKPGGGTETFTTEVVTDNLHRPITRRVVNRDDSQDKHVTTTEYSSLGVPILVTNAEGNETAFEHNGQRQVTRKSVDLGSGQAIVTVWGFDLNGNQNLLRDDNQNDTTWTFNERDLPERITYADSNYREFSYLDDDSLAGWTDENGTEVTNGYNDNGWLTSRDIDRAANVLGPTEEDYYYDGLGRLTAAENDDSVVENTYDTLSRLTSQTQGPNPLGQDGKTITYGYHDDGSRASVEYFSGYDLTYTVDAVGRWTKIEDASSNDLVTWSYYGPGRRIGTVSNLNGTTSTNTWNGFRWVSAIDHEDSGSTEFAGFDYAYDAVGNPLYEERSHDSGEGDAYAYDKAHRLTAALMGSTDPSAEIADQDWLDYSFDRTIEYDMDDVSNRSSVTETPYGQGGSSTSYTSNSVNWYPVVGGVTRTRDANGNLTADGTYDYYYDYRNNLVKVEENSAVVAEYEFDALGRRTKKTVGSDVTKFYYDGEECVEEYDASDNLLRKFVYGQRIDEIRLMIAPDVADVDGDQNTTEVLTFHYHHNMLGSVSHITGPSETVVEQYEYTPYGETTIRDGQGGDLSGQSAIGNPYMFTARRLDGEAGLYHYRRRAYDSSRGRFLQRDPLGFIDGANLFAYAASCPTHYIDPRGECLDCSAAGLTSAEMRAAAENAVKEAERDLQNLQALFDQWIDLTLFSADSLYSGAGSFSIFGRLFERELLNLLHEAREKLAHANAHLRTTIDLIHDKSGIETDWVTTFLPVGGVFGKIIRGCAIPGQRGKAVPGVGTQGSHQGFIEGLKSLSPKSLRKIIRSLGRRIEEHLVKLRNAEDVPPIAREGVKRHWQKEIKNWREQVELVRKELERRGLGE